MQNIINAVEKYRTMILEAERFIWNHPETGFRETVTSGYMEEQFRALGYDLVMADGITGFYTVIDTGRPGPELLILGELDSIICPGHKEADPMTGAVHSCGHNAQCAALLGVAAALKEPGLIDELNLSGRIRLCAVPAEELLEIGYRTELKNKGVIKYFGGKTEFLHRGYFDGVDLAFMVHTSGSYSVNGGSVGCMSKKIIYKGVAAHAGGSPWGGKNALYAATCGINAVNAIRETFSEPDIIRVHPIITHGGDMVNAIPAEVTLESYVRGSSFKAITNANKKVNRALTGAALSIGTNIEIIDAPGYGPHHNAPGMKKIAEEAAKLVIPDYPMS
ncbi:MAG: M20/M25/M40 family metallo-hydrolase, partial [Clostridia bacterium]|nr:M20/M25/M40 family metallo-hydrolase [Clostridia bacterium]